jgi:hypothetical protein
MWRWEKSTLGTSKCRKPLGEYMLLSRNGGPGVPGKFLGRK